jgi:hypothetical protein
MGADQQGDDEMKALYLGIALAAAPALAAPAGAQSRADQQRWDAAQARYRAETDLYQRERDRYYRVSASRGGYYAQPDYAPPPPPAGYDPRYDQGGYDRRGPDESRFATDYDAARDYRAGSYQPYQMSASDQAYRGSDGRYYCKRKDGSTGLILGAAGGGILGNVIDGGRNRIAGTLIGGALGALAGKSIDQNSGTGYTCR